MNSQICQCNTECLWLLSTLLLILHASFIPCTWLAFKIPRFNAIHGLLPRQELSPLWRLLGYLKVGNASRPNFDATSNKTNVWTFETAFYASAQRHKPPLLSWHQSCKQHCLTQLQDASVLKVKIRYCWFLRVKDDPKKRRSGSDITENFTASASPLWETQHSTSWEAKGDSHTQYIIRLARNLQINYRVHKSQVLGPIISQTLYKVQR
jgi:hypothetical protein